MLALQNTILAHCFINTLPFQIDSTTNSYISTHYNTNFQYVFWMTAVIRQPDIKNGRVYSNWALIYILHTFHVSVFIFCRYEYCCKTNFCQCKNKIFQVELGKINDSRQSISEVHSSYYSVGTGVLLQGSSGQGVKLTTHFYIVVRLKMTESLILPPPHLHGVDVDNFIFNREESMKKSEWDLV